MGFSHFAKSEKMIQVAISKGFDFLGRLKTAATEIANGLQQAKTTGALLSVDQILFYKRHEKFIDLDGRDCSGRFRLVEAAPSAHEVISSARSIASSDVSVN